MHSFHEMAKSTITATSKFSNDRLHRERVWHAIGLSLGGARWDGVNVTVSEKQERIGPRTAQMAISKKNDES